MNGPTVTVRYFTVLVKSDRLPNVAEVEQSDWRLERVNRRNEPNGMVRLSYFTRSRSIKSTARRLRIAGGTEL